MPSAAEPHRTPDLTRLADLDEARRVLTLCTVCGYCDGLCEVFTAAEAHPDPDDATVTWLAHLCHACRSCLPACQYAPPHPFSVTVPLALSRVREAQWRRRPWLAVLVAVLVPLATLMLTPADVLFAVHVGPGAFYRVIPLPVILAASALALVWPLWRLGRDIGRFMREIEAPLSQAALGAALAAILTTRPLDGGGPGCSDDGVRLGHLRRRAHLGVMHGFLLAFAATAVATIEHHVFGWPAPYPLASLPVILGTLGGIAMTFGSIGLVATKLRGDPGLDAAGRDVTLPVLLGLTAVSGLALLGLRETAAMGLALAVHLGLVLGVFATLADGRFAHAPWRAAAVLRAAMERADRVRRGVRGRGAKRVGGRGGG